MQRRVYNLGLLIILSLSILSCTTHIGSMQGSRCKGNCFYNSIAVGTAEKFQFMGMGGNHIDAILFEAKRNLYRAFPLEKGEFYDNFVTDFKTTNYIFVTKTLVTITADVVTENGDDSDHSFSENYKLSLSAGKANSIDGINLSDSVVFLKGNTLIKGIVIDFSKNKARVIVNSDYETQVIETVPVKNLFTIGNEELEDISDLEAGQVIEYTSHTTNEGETIVKTIVGLRSNEALISKSVNNKISYSVLPIGKVK